MCFEYRMRKQEKTEEEMSKTEKASWNEDLRKEGRSGNA